MIFAGEGTTSICKREVLSDVSKLYDPLGLISPVVFFGKVSCRNYGVQTSLIGMKNYLSQSLSNGKSLLTSGRIM